MYIVEVALSMLCLYIFQGVSFDESYKLIWRTTFASVAFLQGFSGVFTGNLTEEKFEEACFELSNG